MASQLLACVITPVILHMPTTVGLDNPWLLSVTARMLGVWSPGSDMFHPAGDVAHRGPAAFVLQLARLAGNTVMTAVPFQGPSVPC